MSPSIYLYFIWMLAYAVKLTTALWKLSTDSLFHASLYFASGVYNNTIYILGGKDNENQITTYNARTGTLVYIGQDVLNLNVYGYSQYWTQIEHILYLIAPIDEFEWSQLAAYNLANNTFIPNFKPISYHVEHRACLASHYPYLYVVGGGEFALYDTVGSLVQILNVLTMQWSFDASKLLTPRGSFACVVHNNYLWAFSGYSEQYDNGIYTNERVNITNIAHQTWHYVDPLSEPFYAIGVRAIAWYDVIYIIGGKYLATDDTRYLNIVHIMDAETGSVIVSSDYMPNRVHMTAPIIVDTILYAFGGVRDSQNNLMTNWMYYNLSTHSPTKNPTINPTKYPTLTPTKHHTLTPTTKTPTVAPIVSLFTSSDTLHSSSDIKPQESQSNNSRVMVNMVVVLMACGSLILSILIICVLLCVVRYLWMQLKAANAEGKVALDLEDGKMLDVNDVKMTDVTRDAMKNDKIVSGVISTNEEPSTPQKVMKCAQCGDVLAGEKDKVLCEKCGKDESSVEGLAIFGTYESMETGDKTTEQ